MSATIKYKGNTIAAMHSDASKTLKTSGKYCEADIVVENVQDGGGITPTGTKSIIENGIYDVTQFASASVNVPTGLTNCKQWTATVASRIVSTDVVMIDADADLAAHRADESMMVAIAPVSMTYTSGVANLNSVLTGNKRLAGLENFYGISGRRTAANAVGASAVGVPLNDGGGSVGRIYITSTGRLTWLTTSTYGLEPGTYRITAWW